MIQHFEAAYLGLPAGELARRAALGLRQLERCRVCPRDCDVNRLRGRGRRLQDGSPRRRLQLLSPLGEEDCLRGWNGSGTIFFSHCNLRCVFCQNYDISQAIKAAREPGSAAEEIAGMMLELQARGCHNINFVTPSTWRRR